MKALKRWHCFPESVEQQAAAGRCNPGLRVVLETPSPKDAPEFPIGAGSEDDIEVFQEGNRIIVLCMNDRLDYVGIEVFDTNGEAVEDIFLQGTEQMEETLGKRGLDLSPMTIAKRLLEHVY